MTLVKTSEDSVQVETSQRTALFPSGCHWGESREDVLSFAKRFIHSSLFD